ncbi:zf-HC2 domain-containing protein, partial [Corynebacterium sp.]
MECAEVRAALSARLDGEDAAVPGEIVDAHVAQCEECQAWYAQ